MHRRSRNPSHGEHGEEPDGLEGRVRVVGEATGEEGAEGRGRGSAAVIGEGGSDDR